MWNLRCRSLCIALGLEAREAQNRATALFHRSGLEGDLTLGTTLGAHCGEHLARRETLGLAVLPAVLAALGGAEVAGSVELLFTVGERKCPAAIAACQLLISHKQEKKCNE